MVAHLEGADLSDGTSRATLERELISQLCEILFDPGQRAQLRVCYRNA